MSGAFYNEWERYPAQWIRNLAAAGHVAEGVVDERSIRDVRAVELVGHRQVHFFAGLGGWSRALRLAGWPDDRPVWTASCPCQPFSTAGKQRGFDDDRHLWPVLFELVRECRPAILFGEQVASRDGLAWLDAVSADLEGAGYAVGAADLCAAGVGAPHIRQRLYFVGILADAGRARPQGWGVDRQRADECAVGESGVAGDVADTEGGRRIQRRVPSRSEGVDRARSSDRGRPRELADADGQRLDRIRLQLQRGRSLEACAKASRRREARELGNPDSLASGRDGRAVLGTEGGARGMRRGDHGSGPASAGVVPGPVNGPWSDAEWIACTDGKARPAQPGSFPLAHGVPDRVGKLRAYGNAIVAPLAAEFIGAVMDVLDARSAT